MVNFRRSSTTPSATTNESKNSQIPPFLQQSWAERRQKFDELEWLQRARYTDGMRQSGASPTQYSRLGMKITSDRNRYSNIDPWQNNRVRLRVAEGYNDYINASPIALKCTKSGITKRYIATQGPTSSTTPHLYRMLQHSTTSQPHPVVVIMLTKTHDAAREKCFPYYPRSMNDSPILIKKSSEFGDDLTGAVHLVSSSYDSSARTTIRELRLEIEEGGQKQEKKIWHLLFEGWPDFGVPDGADKIAMLKLIDLSAKLNTAGPESPRVVHCSAGVGRTGTFIALDYLFSELDEGALDDLPAPLRGKSSIADGRRKSGGAGFAGDPVAGTVDQLRKQRMMMVQGESQFHFLYELLKERWLERAGREKEAKDLREDLVRR